MEKSNPETWHRHMTDSAERADGGGHAAVAAEAVVQPRVSVAAPVPAMTA